MPLTNTLPSLDLADQADDATIVRRFFGAWAAGDLSALDLLVDPNVVLGPIVALLYEREIYRGHAGVADAFRETATRWERFEITVEGVRSVEGRVVADLQLVMAKYGMSCDGQIAVDCEMRDGLIISVVDGD